MRFFHTLAGLLGAASLVDFVAADLRIKADGFGFGGVNFPGLQILPPKERDAAIRAIVKSGAKVIRLFIRGNEKYPDPEIELGGFDRGILDMFDATLAAIYHISRGTVKVIIAPHDAHALRGTNGIPCDEYCKKLDGAFLDFYSLDEYKEKYKTRLQVFFKEYPSLNFGGSSWSALSDIILGIDLQNEPWSGIWPIVAGEQWLCEMATHLKDTLELGEKGIAIITGGISGAQTHDGVENYPDSAFKCPAVDVISFHGYYAAEDDKTAGTNWADLFLPGNTLTARAQEKGKLLMVEEMSYVHTKAGLTYKKSAIWDQGNALNYRGIPWMYSQLTTGGEGTTSAVSILRPDTAAIGALKDVLTRASTSRSNFDWSRYVKSPPHLSNLTHVAINPYIHDEADCTFGCPGYLCDAADSCRPDLICKNSVCVSPPESQPGIVGAECNSKKPCQEHLQCEDGTCQECIARPSIEPKDPRKRAIPGFLNFLCENDNGSVFNMRPWCLKPLSSSDPRKRGNPCESPMHCDANEFCDWGLCKPCKDGDACLGAKCKSNNKCKTGFCNTHGNCDYPGLKIKQGGPGARARARSPRGLGNQPKDQPASGPNKVRSEALKIQIPKETVRETGAGAMPTS